MTISSQIINISNTSVVTLRQFANNVNKAVVDLRNLDAQKLANSNVIYAISGITPTSNSIVIAANTSSVYSSTISNKGKDLLTKITNKDQQLSLGIREVLSTDRNYYIRTTPVNVSISIASPGVVTWNNHGLSANDPVIFAIPPYQTIVTMTSANPGVVTWSNHGFSAGQPIKFYTTGALPTNVTSGTTYYVLSTGLTTNTFRISATLNGSAVNTTSGTQSGTHFAEKTGTMPTGLVAGTIYYVKTVQSSNAFTVSSTPGGTEINTTGSTAGTITCQTGNDSNDGLSNTRTGALLTIQRAYNLAAALDTSVYNVNILVSDGHYGGVQTVGKGINGSGWLACTRNATYPKNVNCVSTTGNGSFITYAENEQYFEGLYVGDAGAAAITVGGGYVGLSNMVFAPSYVAMSATGGTLQYYNTLLIFEASSTHSLWSFGSSAYVVMDTGTAYLLSGYNNSGAFAYAAASGQILSSITFVGTATGKRYIADPFGWINVSGAGASYFPGSVAGTTDALGKYS